MVDSEMGTDLNENGGIEAKDRGEMLNGLAASCANTFRYAAFESLRSNGGGKAKPGSANARGLPLRHRFRDSRTRHLNSMKGSERFCRGAIEGDS
jgi:hypothetical protein